MSYDHQERIRRAAILVASIDESLAEQMLDSLPASEATKILAEVDRLGEIDPDEQRDVLAEFRRAGRREKEPAENGVEFTYSAPQAVTVGEQPAEPTLPAIDEAAMTAEATLIADLLGAEHPQTIAVALSRMEHERGAAVFARLAPALQEDVLSRLANLQITDESSVTELETELQQRIDVQRRRRDQATAAAEMARRIVSRTEPVQRNSLLARISPQSGVAAIAEPATMPTALTDQQTRELEEAIQQARELVAAQEMFDADDEEGFEAWTDGPEYGDDVLAFDPAFLEDRSRELEKLSDAALLRALQAAEERTVQLALACSSERFLRRVAAKLPRPAAGRLRMAVRSIGPTRLVELRAAQHELLRLAEASISKVAA